MTREEFYNAMVNVYNETGQGIPAFIAEQMDPNIIKGLLDDGLIVKHTMAFNHLPDDETFCLAKGYCVEEGSTKANMNNYVFMRFYRGLDQGLQGVGSPSNKELVKDPKFIKDYLKWLTINQKKLEEVVKPISCEAITSHAFTKEEKEYLEGLEWFNKNETIRSSLNRLRERSSRIKEIIKLSRELVNLTEGSKKHEELHKKTLNDIDSAVMEMKIRDRIEDVLLTANDKDVKIQDFYSNL